MTNIKKLALVITPFYRLFENAHSYGGILYIEFKKPPAIEIFADGFL